MSSILCWFCFEVDFYCKLFFIKIGSLFHEKTNLFGLKAVMSNTFSLVRNQRILNAFQTFNEINIWWFHFNNQLLNCFCPFLESCCLIAAIYSLCWLNNSKFSMHLSTRTVAKLMNRASTNDFKLNRIFQQNCS